MDIQAKNYILEHQEDINNDDWNKFFFSTDVNFAFRLIEVLDAAGIVWRPFVEYMKKGFIHNGETEYTIPSNIKRLGVDSIPPSLKKLTIPKSIEKIRPAAFDDSTLTEITYEGTMQDWKKIDRPLYWTFMKKIHCTDGDIIIEDGEDKSVNE